MIARWADEKRALIHVDGKLLSLAAHGDYGAWSHHLGEREHPTFGRSGQALDIDLKSTWVCRRGDESCEVAEYRGTLSVTIGTRTGALPVWAACGC